MKSLSQFFLFQSHLDLAHSYWKDSLNNGDIAIDATCGNGYDTLALAQLIFDKTEQKNGQLIALDRQKAAIDATHARLKSVLPEDFMQHIYLLEQCHSSFPNHLAPESVALIVYNLGYLPGGNKSLTTERSTTLQSLQAALPLIKPQGSISITCYPGHEEGLHEENAVKEFAAALDPRDWSSCHHSWLNRKKAPSLLIIQKAIQR